jgi:hypothetical protein
VPRLIQIDGLVEVAPLLAPPPPPPSPDLNPCDFFLWGHLQNFVYATPIANLEELTERINAAVNTINVPMLQRVQENIVRRAAMCIEVGGRYFEQLL